MELHLSAEIEQLLLAKVASGNYASAADVVSEALSLLEERDQDRARQLAALRSRIDQALADAARGDVADGERFLEDLISAAKARSCSGRSATT